ncbi:MAG: leucine-rich repeat domain-containing protein [Candidatus Heimdallarchaeota archaeon]
MSSEEERINELLFVLRRDFTISKEVVNALSEIGPGVIPYLIDTYKIDDFAFRLKIIETLGKMGEIGLPGLVGLLDHSDIKNKITILKTIRKSNKYTSSINKSIIKKMEGLIEWKFIEYTNFQDLEDKIFDILQFRDQLVKTLLEIDMLGDNKDKVEELAFLTTHIYLRRIQHREIKTELYYFYTKLLENKKITKLEYEVLYKNIYKKDSRMDQIIRSYMKSNVARIKSDTLDAILKIVGDRLARGLILKKCDRNFYVYNYDSDNVRNRSNYAFHMGMVYLFSQEQLEAFADATTVDVINEMIAEMWSGLDQELENIPLSVIIGEKGINETIKAGIINLDLSVKNLERVDLDPIADCKQLEFLNLGDNQLTTIDLSPLQNCKNLQHFDLSKNKLTYLVLDPLSSCKKLKYLVIDYNQISKIDLTPIRNNPELLEFKIMGNQLTAINLAPLSNCKQLVELDLSENPLESLNITPLTECEELEFLGVNESTKLLLSKTDLPSIDDLPEGLREHYSRLTIDE